MVDRLELAAERPLQMLPPQQEIRAAGAERHHRPTALARPFEERQMNPARFVGDRQRPAAAGP
jgi:hypothetical protein